MNAVLSPEDSFDFLQPDYAAIFRERSKRLARIRAHPERLPALRAYYRDHLVDFVSQWAISVDPRNVSVGIPAYLPFVLMPKQREMAEFILQRWRNREPGIIEKSRDVGASVLAMALACSICLFHDGVAIGFGSAKEDKLDRTGDPDTLFYKGRTFLENLPPEFRNGWDADNDSMYMRLLFPATGSSITGEAGDQIGRGGRKSILFIDEAAHLQHPELVDAATIATTDCRIDISSVNGMANSFATRRHSGKFKVFTMHYRDDLRKDDAWRKAKQEKTDPTIWNAEYELDYLASVEGVIIPPAHVQAMVDAHKKLGIEPTGVKRGALDVADEGRDLNAFAARHGVLVNHCEAWRGKGSFLHETTDRAYLLCDELMLDGFDYDCDGMGAGVRSDVDRINKRRAEQRLRKLRIGAHQGSAGVFNPDQKMPGTDRTAKDFFQNFKAQSWYEMKRRAAETARAVLEGGPYDRDLIVSLDSRIPNLNKLCIELSQAQWKLSATGKIMVDKVPDGAMSPNMADAVVILHAPRRAPMRISDLALEAHEEY